MIKSKNTMKLEKIATGQEDDYTTGYLLDYQYFIDHYQIVAAVLVNKNN